jgi:adenylate cyclase
MTSTRGGAFGFGRTKAPPVLFAGVVVAIAALHATPLRERADNAALDATQRIVRALAPRPAVEDVVIVGIDEDTERSFPEPFALWHRPLGAALAAIARGEPRLIALDVVLPELSYDGLVPGLNEALLRGVVAAKHPDRLVVGLRLDPRGRPLQLDSLLLAAIGQDAVGVAYVTVDGDGTARRFDAPRSRGAVQVPLLAERIAAMLGFTPRGGIIDFSCGKPFAYIPMQDVIALARDRPQALTAAFAGKIVLLGQVGPDEDQVRQPLSLASWASEATSPPGVVLLAQTVRALQSGRILAELHGPALALLVALGAAVALVGGLWRTWAAACLMVATIAALVYVAYLNGTFVPPTSAIAAVLLGATARSTLEAFEHLRFRRAIERQFAGYVSQNLLEALVAGEVDPRQPRKYANLGFLFADIRGFTTLAERLPPEEVLALLNRYYEAITPAIHAFDGTIDNFRGDGILAIFGAPRPAEDGPRRAVLAAREIFTRLDMLNSELAREGRITLDIGIGLAAGDAVAGNVGTVSRYGYSAVGDAVNVSARLQSLCKPLKMKIVASEAVARACAGDLPFVPLGQVELAGHASIDAFGVPRQPADPATGAPERSAPAQSSYA